MVQAHLGLDPWNALHEGLTHYLPVSFGVVTILSGLVVTVVNTVLVGLFTDVALRLVPTPTSLALRAVFLVVGVVLCGVAGAVYLGSHLGPGPRDGLMTGLVRRTGRSIRLVRTSLEVGLLVLGFLLGGTVGVKTGLFAVAIGPLIQFFLPRVAVPLALRADDDRTRRG